MANTKDDGRPALTKRPDPGHPVAGPLPSASSALAVNDPARSSNPAMVQMSFRLPKETRHALRMAALVEEREIQELIYEAIETYLATKHKGNGQS